MAKNQLHQLLAVLNDRVQQAGRIIAETKQTFSKRAEHFDGLVKTYSPVDEDGETLPPEIKDISECTGCMNCMIYCPDFAIVVEKDPEDESERGENRDE